MTRNYKTAAQKYLTGVTDEHNKMRLADYWATCSRSASSFKLSSFNHLHLTINDVKAVAQELQSLGVGEYDADTLTFRVNKGHRIVDFSKAVTKLNSERKKQAAQPVQPTIQQVAYAFNLDNGTPVTVTLPVSIHAEHAQAIIKNMAWAANGTQAPTPTVVTP